MFLLLRQDNHVLHKTESILSGLSPIVKCPSFSLTQKGYEYIRSHEEDLKYLFSSDFDYSDILNNLGRISKLRNPRIVLYKEFVSEGELALVTTKIAKRSQKLRNAALEHFSHNGIIRCDCCGFEFADFYGEKYGKPCIEIHHMKPIFQYGGASINQTIDEALSNLLPVCPNCHRVIHKNHITASMIPDFKQSIILHRVE